jgi:Fibronectin type III domain
MHGSKSKNSLSTVTIILTLALAACSNDDGSPSKPAATSGSTATNGSKTGGPSTGSATSPALLSITGAPNRQVVANQPYWFRPVANNTMGATPRFGISNPPHWSRFNAATGEVTGTPESADVGVYRGITVTVTAGTQMRAMSFDVEVVQVGTNSIMISWLAPTENEDGTPLTNLAGYRIRYGQQTGAYTSVVNVTNPGLASYVINGLAAGTYYLVLSAVNTNGGESANSNEASLNLG